MLFSSIPFLYYFLPAVVGLYFALPWLLQITVATYIPAITGKLTGGSSTFGGAIGVQAGSTLNIFGGTITGNSADRGGAAYVTGKSTSDCAIGISGNGMFARENQSS